DVEPHAHEARCHYGCVARGLDLYARSVVGPHAVDLVVGAVVLPTIDPIQSASLCGYAVGCVVRGVLADQEPERVGGISAEADKKAVKDVLERLPLRVEGNHFLHLLRPHKRTTVRGITHGLADRWPCWPLLQRPR